MKNTNKKGFTIVELVIVIAVIAILAAVLIPTFVGLVNKANQAADQALAKELNTVLTMAEAEGAEIDDFNDALKALRDGGYIVANLNPSAKGWFYVWESESNQILIVDSNENKWEVVYSAKTLNNTTPGATWHFAVSDISKVATIESLGAKVVYAPKNVEALEGAFADVYAKGGTIVVSEDITMGSGQFLMKNDLSSEAKATIDLAGNTITNTSNIDYIVTGLETSKRFGQLTAASGTLLIANGTVNSSSDSSFVISAIENGKVEVENVVVNNLASGGVALRVLGETADMKVSNTTINLNAKGGGCEIGIGTATFDNVNITINPENEHFSGICLSASRGGTLTVNSGVYTAKGNATGVIGLYTTAGHVVINGGTFKAENNAGKIFMSYLPTNTAYGTEHTITLNGGTFVMGDKTVNISNLTEENYESEIRSLFKDAPENVSTWENHIVIEKIDGGYKVTIK